MAKKYTVSDGKLVLTLKEAEEGSYIVTSPMELELITEADTVREAFEMARDANIPAVDLRHALREADVSMQALYLLPEDGHPSALGHQFAARGLARELEQWTWFSSLCANRQVPKSGT